LGGRQDRGEQGEGEREGEGRGGVRRVKGVGGE